jgi:hypothetical protein
MRKHLFRFRGYEYGIRYKYLDKWNGDPGITNRSRFFIGFGIGRRFRIGVSNAIYDFKYQKNGNYTELFLGPCIIVFYKTADTWK